MRLMARGPVILALVCVITGIPFLRQAYTNDGPTFVAVALHLRDEPGGIASMRYDHLGMRYDNYIPKMTHPPLWPYLLAGTYAIVGSDSEVAAHLLTLLFAIVAGLALMRIADRFGVPPIASGLLLVAAPPFLVLSHTVMAEIPAVGLALLGTWLHLRYRDRPSYGRALLAGTALTCAVGVAYQCAPLVLLLAIWGRGRGWKPLLLPLIALLAWWAVPWIAGTRSPLAFGLLPYAATVSSRPLGWIPIKAACLFAYLGLSPPLLMVAAASLRSPKGIAAGVLLLAVGSAVYAWGELQPCAVGGMAFALLFAGGAGAAIAASLPGGNEEGPRSGGGLPLLSIWFWGYVAFSVFCLNFASARHVIILLPPLVILALRRAPRVAAHPLGIAASLALGLLLCLADARSGAASSALPPVSLEPSPWTGAPAYFRGECAFRYYRERAGQRYLLPELEPPEPGDRVIVPVQTATFPLPPELVARLTLLAEIPIEDGLPVRTTHPGARAGLYNHVWGLLPFVISRQPLETIRCFEVNWFLSNLAEARLPEREGLNTIPPESRSLEVGGETRPSLFLHANGEIAYSFRVPRRALLRFATGIPEAGWRQGGDGAEFKVLIEAGSGGRQTIFTRHLDPRRREADRGWQEEVVDLAPWGGEEIELTFQTGGGPLGDLSYDWSAWADPRIRIDPDRPPGSNQGQPNPSLDSPEKTR